MENTAPADKPENLTASFEQVVSLCDAFTKDWQHSSGASIASYLERVGAEAQPTLFRNLLEIEIERRRHVGEQPRLEQYVEKFPKYASLMRNVFLEHSRVSAVGPREPERPKAVAFTTPAASRLGDYRLLRELGRGGMGVVYEAMHLHRGNRVALKTLPRVDGAALHRFKREFRALADVNHPNLIGLHALEADGCHWFFTMDLLQGEDFLTYVRPSGTLDESRLRLALAQLAVGVMALHGHHIVHRDLKPSNVMVSREGHVVLLDFGLVVDLDEARGPTRTEEIAGTPTYMAPEQASGRGSTPACDWYAVGVMLYEALAGKPPFAGSLHRVLQDKQQLDPPALPEGSAIPDDLAALCMNLLARAPEQRPDALAITRVIASHAAPTRASTTPGWHLVGRASQLAALQDAYRSLKQQEPLTSFISGRSGEGKTTLAEHFLGFLRLEQHLVVLSGRCYDRETVPFKALDSLIDALATFLRSLPEDSVKRLIPADIGVLAQVFLVLQRVEAIAEAPRAKLGALDEQQVRQRAFAALRELLRRIGTGWPLILFVDDLQWGDADSAEVLIEVLRPPGSPPILFLGTYRSDEAEASPFLRTWEDLKRKQQGTVPHHDVKVGPLTVEECVELVLSLLEKDNEALRRRALQMAVETGGNPFLLIELVGCFDPEADSFQPMEMHEVLARKLGRLPADAEHLLEVVAVSGQALSLEEASRAAGHPLVPVSTIMHMRNERLVRLVGTDDRSLVDTYHDRVRETVLGQLEDARNQTIHLSLARVIEEDAGAVSDEFVAALEGGVNSRADEARPNPRVYDLAYHFDAARQKKKAWVYSLLAAEQARRQFALEVTAKQYAIAKRNAGETTDAVRYRIAEGCGEALMLLGRYEDAGKQLDGAIQLGVGAEKKATIEALLGEIAFKQGSMEASIAYYESGLRRLGQRAPRTLFGFGVGLLRESLIQCWHSLFPGRLHRQPLSSQLDLTSRLLTRLVYPYWFRNTFKMLWTQLAGMNLAERLPPSPRLAFHYALHSFALSILGWSSRGSRYGNRSIALNHEFNDVWGRGHSFCFNGLGLYSSARYEESIASLTEAIDLYSKTGDLWELKTADFHLGSCHFGLGNLAQAVEKVRKTFAVCVHGGEDTLACGTIYLWSRATGGNLPFDELRSCFHPRPDDFLGTTNVLMAEGHWHWFHGRTGDALQAFQRAYALARNNLVINCHTIPALPSLVTALRLHADATEGKDRRQSELLRKRALRLARWGARLLQFFPTEHAYGLREMSVLLAATGRTRQALQYADRSCAVAAGQKARYEHAQSLLVRGRLALHLGRPEAAAQIQTAEAALHAIEQPVQAG